MNHPHYLKEAYSNMIAGSVPNHSGDVNLSIFMIARNTLDTERLHLLVDIDSDLAYYFAVPSRCVTAATEFTTSLAAAFPSHPAHKGDGIYFYERDTFSVAVIKDKSSLRCITNTTDVMAAFIDDIDLPVHHVDNAKPWALETVKGRYRRLANAFSLKLFRVSSAVAGVAVAVAIVAGITGSMLSSQVITSNEQRAVEFNSIIKKIDYTSPLAQQLAQLQKVSATVVRAGGWIDAYEQKNGRETFTLSLPAWVTQDYIMALGQGAIADYDKHDNLIRVVKK